ncbi:MAG: ABC transporter ATP-binding protein, partial [Proteobacteria bacterium]|nr:ABC transporter ATP-binding protein [Pseudomonadota bacterium]
MPAQPGADGDLLIHAIGLHSYYGASHILRGIDFAVRRGE